MTAELLALDARIVALHEAEARSLRDPADLAAPAEAAALRLEVATGPLSARPATLLARARRHTRVEVPVPEIDDALAYLYAVYVPPLRPDPTLVRLSDIVAWHERNHDIDTRVEPALWLNAEMVLQRSRHEALRAAAEEHAKHIGRFLDTEKQRHFAIRPATKATEVASAAREELARRLAHGLIYGVEPDALMTTTGEGRIGELAQVARESLATYRKARLLAGHAALGRRTQRLATVAEQADPGLFER